MSSYLGEKGFEHGEADKTGVLLLNLGSPDAPTPSALRRYLKEFLSDPRIVEMPRIIWWFILNVIILNTRPKRSAKLYKGVWLEAGAPLVVTAKAQAERIQQRLNSLYPEQMIVELGMRYGNPSVSHALQSLKKSGAKRIVVLPLYPQYSSAATGSALDAVFDELKQWRVLPDLQVISHYHDAPAYIDALVSSIKAHWATSGQGEKLVFSFHGIPEVTHLAGDPYPCECRKTVRLVTERLGLTDDQWMLCFQSRFGAQEWLKPYTDKSLQQLAKDGVKRVDVVCPGFSADCLETLEEIDIENRAMFLEAGGEQYHYIAALNERDDHIDTLTGLIMKALSAWPESRGLSSEVMQSQQAISRQRALDAGAES